METFVGVLAGALRAHSAAHFGLGFVRFVPGSLMRGAFASIFTSVVVNIVLVLSLGLSHTVRVRENGAFGIGLGFGFCRPWNCLLESATAAAIEMKIRTAKDALK